MLASFILPYDISLQATGNYRSRGVITQGYRKSNGSLDLGLRKTFFNKAIALAINWRDVFNTRHWKTYTSSDTFTRYQENWRDPRVNFTLTWNFGAQRTRKNAGRRMSPAAWKVIRNSQRSKANYFLPTKMGKTLVVLWIFTTFAPDFRKKEQNDDHQRDTR
jgi:hypothetical protein